MKNASRPEYELLDQQQRCLGRISVANIRDGLLTGTLEREDAFASVEGLFREFEEAADSQQLTRVDELDHDIAALGLRLVSSDSSHVTLVSDVQIWSDGGITCRVSLPDVLALEAGKSRQAVTPSLAAGASPLDAHTTPSS